MKIDYQKTIESLQERGIIKPDDKYAIAFFVPETKYYGTFSTTTTAPNDYILVANGEEVALLDIDKRSGQYLESGCIFKKADLVFEKKNKNWVYASKGLFGGRYINIRADFLEKFCHNYTLPKKAHGFDQVALRNEVYDFIKEVYNAHREEQKRIYKESK